MSASPSTVEVRTRRRSSTSVRYDLRRRVLVSNLSRSVTPTLPSTKSTEVTYVPSAQQVLPSKPIVPLDLLRDIPSEKKAKLQCLSPHQLRQTPEKRKFRIDPSVLSSRNPIVHTPLKASVKRRISEPFKDTMSLHLLRDEYVPPAKKDRNDLPFHKLLSKRAESSSKPVVIVNHAAHCSIDQNHYDSPAGRPVPLPRKSKASSRPQSADSASSEDPLYARIENCTTGNHEDFLRYDQPRLRSQSLPKSPLPTSLPSEESVVTRRSQLLRDCTENKRRNSLPATSNISLRPRFNSASGQCRAKKSLLFSDTVDSSKSERGLTLKNIYAEKQFPETPLNETINRLRTSPEERILTPKILNRSGIYSNNTLVVESSKLKKDEIDKSYGFTCRMRPALRALSDRALPAILLPSKTTPSRRGCTGTSEASCPSSLGIPPTPPPRPLKFSRDSPKPQTTTPSKEIATQTSFIFPSDGLQNCQPMSAKKRRSSKEFFAEVGAKVKRQGSIMKRKLRRSLEMTPVK